MPAKAGIHVFFFNKAQLPAHFAAAFLTPRRRRAPGNPVPV